MKRREFVATAGALLALPLSADAQKLEDKSARIEFCARRSMILSRLPAIPHLSTN